MHDGGADPADFALRPGAQPGDSAYLLNQGPHRFAFDAVPGRYVALAFLDSNADPLTDAALRTFAANRRFVDAGAAALFAVADESLKPRRGALETQFSSIEFLWDDGGMARAFGASRSWVILDPMLRVLEVGLLSDCGRAFACLDRLPPPGEAFVVRAAGPILALSNVFEPELCRHLIHCFERGEARESGFMQDEAGRSVENFDSQWKRRRDYMVTDPRLVSALRARIGRRLCPEIKKAYQFAVSRIERDLVARYDAETGGHFGPHRDDTGLLVAHRRFAVSINLNEDFDGGEISFPEFNPRGLKAPPGTAVVFSASILHQVSRVTRGSRYVFLTFLFDEGAERLRQANLKAAREAQLKAHAPILAPA